MSKPARMLRTWTDEEMVLLADLVVAGEPNAAIAERIGRTETAVELRRRRILCPVDGSQPGWGKRPYGQRLYWTRERTIEGLRAFARSNRGRLPTADAAYNVIKKGHTEWPTGQKVLEYFRSMANAWAAAGVSKSRYNRGWNEWSEDDDAYLLEHAGEETLKLIAAHLGRTWPACKRRLYDLKAGRARDVPGWMSAMQVAKEYNCPLARVIRLIETGKLPAFKVKGGHYWRINPIDAEHIRELLRAPKTHSYKNSPPDIGNYEKRYGLRRVQVNGITVRVEKSA